MTCFYPIVITSLYIVVTTSYIQKSFSVQRKPGGKHG